MLTMHFQRKKLVIHVAKMQQILFFVHQLMMNLNCPIRNVSCRSVLSVVLLLSLELKLIHQTEHHWLCLTRIWLNFTFSHHGILIREKITTYYDAKWKSKITCFLCEELIKTKTPNFTYWKLHERVKLFSMQRKIGDFHKDFYIKQIKKLAYHRSY